MTTNANQILVQRYLDEVWVQGNLAAIDALLAPGYRRYLSPTAAPLTREEQRQRIRAFRVAFPDAHLTIEDIFGAGDRVAFRSTLRGTHRGVLLDIEPTGQQVTVALLDVMRVVNGQIVEQWGGPDLYDLLRQLGAVVSVPRQGTDD